MRPRTLKSASEAGDAEAVLHHLRSGSRANDTTAAGHFPLGGAVIFGHRHIVSLLIEHGANVNLKSEYGWTPLYLAAWNGHARIARVLIESGARLNTRTIFGFNSPDCYTPLHIASSNGYLGVVKVLVECGAILNARTGDGETPLDLAQECNQQKVVRFLLAASAKNGRRASRNDLNRKNLRTRPLGRKKPKLKAKKKKLWRGSFKKG